MTSDHLTGIADRATAIAALVDALEVRATAIVVLDLDRFKRVNNSFGHLVGDEVLRQIAKRIAEAADGGQLVARIDGDSFAVVCREPEAEGIAASSRSSDVLSAFPVGMR